MFDTGCKVGKNSMPETHQSPTHLFIKKVSEICEIVYILN